MPDMKESFGDVHEPRSLAKINHERNKKESQEAGKSMLPVRKEE